MLEDQARLTERQVNNLVSFLLDGTDRAILALEEVFGLEVASSDSDIELAPLNQSEFLRHLGQQKLYAVTSDMSGGLEGRISLLLRSKDFHYLGDVMKPVLKLLFLSSPGSDLESLEQDKPDWLDEAVGPMLHGTAFHQQMMDLLAELGNVLIGMYIKSLFQTFRLSSDHTIPRAHEDPEQRILRETALRFSGHLHLIIENEFVVEDHPISIWCMISPTVESLDRLLGSTRH